MNIKGLSDTKTEFDVDSYRGSAEVEITKDRVDKYLADKGLVAVPLEKLKEAEFMLGWNGGYDKTSDILQELLEAAGEGNDL